MHGFDIYYADPLNKAHLLERRAESLLLDEKYEEAIDLHFEASKLLKDVITKARPIVMHENAILSLELQVGYHEKQKDIITLRKKQKGVVRKLQLKQSSHSSMRSSQEPFQTVSTYSTTSIDSYDSTDYSNTVSFNNNLTNGSSEQLAKRDEVIKKMGIFIRQQQNEILALSNKLKKKDSENRSLRESVALLEQKLSELTPAIPASIDVLCDASKNM